MGRKRTPTALKKLKGNPGNRPLNEKEPAPETGIPAPPQGLDGLALEEWERMSCALYNLGLMTPVDMAAFAGYCQHYARWREAEEKIKTEGATIKTTGGNLIQSPWVGIANTSSKLMLKFLSEFGMTPSSRAKVVANPEQEEDDPFSFLD